MDIYESLKEHLPPPTNQTGDDVEMRCPFHKGGKEKNPSFYLNRKTGMAFCHSEHRGWNVLTLMRDLKIPRWKRTHLMGVLEKLGKLKAKKEDTSDPESLPEMVLGLFDHPNDYMSGRGFDEEVLESQEIGYDPKTDRATFPIRGKDGQLLAVSGRQIGGPGPRYKWFKNRFQDVQPGYGPTPKKYLWGVENLWPASRMKRLDGIILVEGFMQRLKLLEYGYDNVLSVLGGAGMSDAQVRLLRDMTNRLYFFFDNDPGGHSLIARGLKQTQGMDVRVVLDYPQGKNQPDDMKEVEVAEALKRAATATRAIRRLKMDRSLIMQRHTEKGGSGGGNRNRTYTDNEMKRSDYRLLLSKDRNVEIYPLRIPMADPCWWEPTYGVEIGYYPVRVHTRWVESSDKNKRGMRFIVCSAGWDEENQLDCHGCDVYDEHGFEGPISRKLIRAVTVMVAEHFHEIQKTGRKGTKYTRHRICRGKKGKCLGCKEGHKKYFGRLMVLEISGKQWNQFLEACKQATDLCAGCGEDINLVAIACQACEEVLLDDETWGDQDSEAFLAKPIKCKSCGTVEYPGGLYECDSKCDGAEPAEIWDCKVKVRRTDGGYNFGEPEVAEMPDELLAKTEPLDLTELYPADTLDDMKSVLMIDNLIDEDEDDDEDY